ncbi:MAG: helix-turn-helix domain-containing protein [Bacteroidia bacterium]|nr:helix-turn-helix domain-containing protein [Bacteroidia bacterium]
MSHKVRLSLEEAYLLADRMKQVSSKKLSRRLLTISLRHFGYKIKDISAVVGVSERTITKWIKLYLEEGLDGLLEQHYPENRGSKLFPHQQAIRQFWVEHPNATLQQLQTWLATARQVEVEYSWLYRYLERNDLLRNSTET